MAPASVLLVDDDTTFRRLVVQFLQELGNDEAAIVDSAEGGFEGVMKAHSLQPDVVLVDLILPDLHGLEVIARLRSVAPRVGIIAMSQFHVDGYRQASLEAGANDFIFKSTLNAALLPAIRRVKGATEASRQEETGRTWIENEALTRFLGCCEKFEGGSQMGTKWQGVGMHRNCGTVEGIALVDENVESATERLLAMPEGEKVILVTSWLQPAWSGVLRRVQGVVTERNGALSNAAIVASELGLAIVAGVDGVASIIPDGQRIRINGISGTVEVLE